MFTVPDEETYKQGSNYTCDT